MQQKQKKASMAELNNLHLKINQYYLEMLDTGEELSSGTLAAINSFLKTNDITVDVIEGASAPGNMAFKLSQLIEAHNDLKEA